MSSEPLYQQRGGFQYYWPVWWFAIISLSAIWPFSNIKVFPEFIEIRTLHFITNRYTREDIAVRRWTLFPVLIDGIAIDNGKSGFRLFSTFRAKRLLDELKQVGFTGG